MENEESKAYNKMVINSKYGLASSKHDITKTLKIIKRKSKLKDIRDMLGE